MDSQNLTGDSQEIELSSANDTTRESQSSQHRGDGALDQAPLGARGTTQAVEQDAQAAAAEQQNFKPSPGWDRATKTYQEGSTLELKVIGYNRGGLLADLSDVRGFVPASQLLNFPRRVGEEERMNELARYVGKMMRLKVIELDRVHNRLILSERVANLPVSRADQVINSIQPGQAIRGTVRNVTDFGAFVDLGGVEGLIHVSEMSWQRVNHPRDVCTPGREIDVYVIDVNRDQRRVGLSLKRLNPDPWSLVAQHYHVGEIVEAIITNVVSFGAFARLPEGVEGLIHTSELAEGSFLHPRDVVKEGQVVKVRIMNIEPTRQRIGLTMRLSDDLRVRPRDAASGPTMPDAGYWDSLARES
jgi:small subunit ribosomal protein S1